MNKWTAIGSALLGLIVFHQSSLSAQSSAVLRDQKVQARLISEVTSVQPGEPFRVGLLLEHDPKWHTYWKSSATGYATSITWDLSEGITAGPIQWPVPQVYEFEGWIEYVYEGEVLLMSTLQLPADYSSDTLRIGFLAEWLMCADVCIPGEVAGELVLPVASNAPPRPSAQWAELFTATTASLPVAPPDGMLAAFGNDRSITLQVSAELPEQVYFFDDAGVIVVPMQMPLLRSDDSSGSIVLQLHDATAQMPERLTGILAATPHWPAINEAPAVAVDIPIASGPPPAAATQDTTAIFKLLLLAFAGGLILNLMPCVFPVLGIKVMGFVNQAGESKLRTVQHGLSFTAGVLLSFWLLAGALLLLRSGGQQLGWGFQLQSAGFVYFLALFLFAFALNMSGLFEVGQSAVGIAGKADARSGLSGSFLSGILATVVATPCAAPFLAPALGAALTLPPVTSLLVFTTIGIGLAMPYLTLSAFPSLTALLPRPGPWMESFKQFMSFLLYATVAFLLWVLAAQLSEEAGHEPFALLRVLLALVAVAMGLWIYGRWAAFHKPLRTRWIAGTASFLTIAGAVLFAMPPANSENESAASLEWREWQPGLANQLAEQGQLVYVDFTARWCVTCQTNKAAVFSSSEINDRVRAGEITLLRADWTNRDDRISDALAAFGRSAVPFNLVYGPNAIEQPIQLPELLTPSIVIDAFAKAKSL